SPSGSAAERMKARLPPGAVDENATEDQLTTNEAPSDASASRSASTRWSATSARRPDATTACVTVPPRASHARRRRALSTIYTSAALGSGPGSGRAGCHGPRTGEDDGELQDVIAGLSPNA